MKIFAISVVKNEADIIAANLLAASQWADKIFVLDNGSTDATWEIVQSLASDKIVPYKQDFSPFYDGIRAQVFNHYRWLAQAGDWWCYRLDADEIYADNPREFLPRVPTHHHFVASETIFFNLTKEDFAGGSAGPASVDEIRYYQPSTWSEARFFRHRPGMEWAAPAHAPKHMGVLHNRRIKIKHYQFRSLDQIKQRVAVRQQAREGGCEGFGYSINEDVNEYLLDRAALRRYEPGQPWQLTGPQNQLYQRWYDVALKTFCHATGLYK
ncbi:glycosyltransferase family 2 protein [Hymenobacter glacieicola]|uniref:Glycosyltransferase 2-like domain-containing protein n=1 Tax=Hymenobacter glacieicola TaxID=1562124 RepID=A0ABQ1X8S5_9BACT|nr:glycosyltransferase family 2 protein [Hymenobacter glacieicola]GGG60944.1 hypothetical protein GCM10011378_41180 [Hymenobacter glacieicola]